MKRLSLLQFSVPTWEYVTEHDEYARQVPIEKPPDLRAEAVGALEDGRILVASFDGEDGPEPYMLTGGEYPYYAQRGGESLPKEAPGVGPIASRYGFHPLVPDQVDEPVSYDAREMSFELATTPEDTTVLIMWTGKKNHGHILEVGKPGDPLDSALIRAAVCVHVLEGLDGRATSLVLPMRHDTEPIARARLVHVLRWQLRHTRMRPLFA